MLQNHPLTVASLPLAGVHTAIASETAPAAGLPALSVGSIGLGSVLLTVAAWMLWSRRIPTNRAARFALLGIAVLCFGIALRALLFLVSMRPPFASWDPSMDLSVLAFAIVSSVFCLRLSLSATVGGHQRRMKLALRSLAARARRKRAEIVAARDSLERRSAELTTRMRQLQNAIESAGAVACQWDIESGSFLWEVGVARRFRQAGLRVDRELARWADVVGPVAADTLRSIAVNATKSGERLDFEAPLISCPSIAVRVSAKPDPTVRDAPARVTGMFRLVDVSKSAETRVPSVRVHANS